MQLQDDMEHPELELKRRRRRTTSIIPDEADAEKNKNRIGTLPDEILIDIISRLSLYEAGRTSVFSRGWRDLWKFTSGSLDFVGDQHDPKTVDPTRFLTWVNQVLELHQAPYVDKLSISFRSRIDDYDDDDDGGSPSPIVNSIGRWIRFVLQKEVRVFELQLFPGNRFPSPDLDTFSSLLVKLKSLRLVNVNIKDKTMEHLLSICPYLEKLSLEGSGYTKYLSVVSQSLKSLVVKHCHKLKSLVISSENLVSFEGFYNRDDPVYFDNVPLLSELKISGRYCESFVLLPQHHSHYCGQLEKLLLLVRSEMMYYCTLLFRRQIELPRLHNLKQLELIFSQAGESILYFVLFTKACPSLSTMQVQFTDIDAQSQEPN
ncbi:hypothetical protein ACH5RR_008093 [Cinchona calisaya]|uniref:F-box domain-containing protein n=1 Tax=Cinchona calisaya TaxID=153742 RepID=A0ABD3AAJ6_9GENT